MKKRPGCAEVLEVYEKGQRFDVYDKSNSMLFGANEEIIGDYD